MAYLVLRWIFQNMLKQSNVHIIYNKHIIEKYKIIFKGTASK